ncbi:MAG: zf-HC2 domain-containing protein [Roseburia sp.]|nr:zf-HC2 domain-containing protein [Roseburia sp.]MCM1099121.1 zf-HC2 domain-containing protein [Ruminococcus flavefaciens]
MDCKEFERLISDFIDRKLDYPTLKKFCEHMERCEECKEELVIQFLVTEGVQRLEDGGAFDLQKELDQRLEEARHELRIHDGFMRIGIALEVLAAALLAAIILWILL